MSLSNNFGLNIDQEFQSGMGGWGSPNGDNSNWQQYYPTAQVLEDFTNFKRLNITRLRIAGVGYSSNVAFQVNTIASHFHTVELALQNGFDVAYGVIPQAGIGPAAWTFFLGNILPYVQQFQSLLAQYGGTGTFYIGNENEYIPNLGRDIITSMSRTSNVVTVIMPTAHNMQTGDGIIYYNAATGNGSGSTMGINSNTTFSSVTVIDAFTFSFSSTNTDGSSTIGWISWSPVTARNTMRRLATTLKAAGITVPLSYSSIGDTFTAGANPVYYIDSFVSEGRGSLDFVDINIYGEPFSDLDARLNGFTTQVNKGVAGFGVNHFRVTEWNLFATNTGVSTIVPIDTRYMIQRLNYLESVPGLINYHFCYREKNNLLILQRPYNTDHTDTSAYLRDWWWPMIGYRQGTQES